MLRRPQPRFSLSMFSENLVVGVWKSLVLLASWDQRRLFQLWGNACPLSYLGSLCVLSGSPAQGRCGERALSPFTWHGILFPSRVDRWLVQLAGHECITHMCTVFLLLAGGEAQGHGSKSAKVETRLGFFFFFLILFPAGSVIYSWRTHIHFFFSPAFWRFISSLAIQKGSGIWSEGTFFVQDISDIMAWLESCFLLKDTGKIVLHIRQLFLTPRILSYFLLQRIHI